MTKRALEFLTQGLILLIAIYGITCSSDDGEKGIVLFKFDFPHISKPFIVCAWILFASLAKIAFHYSEFVSNYIPESCMLIAIGIPIGLLVKYVDAFEEDSIFLTSDLFFYYLLPPIILDAGYFMPSNVFYYNIGTILLYAVFGTVFNSFAVGLSLAGVSGICGLNLPILKGLLFGSLISAVDPVAVLAVFEEVHVHEVLYMLVFGESVLNDAASVVLYRTMQSLDKGDVNAEQIGLAFASFFVVSIGGFLIGVIFALTTSFITKFTEHVTVIEPAFVFLMAYLSYLTAEIFHFSGIVSILFCGIVMKPYVESNVSRKSHTTIKYFLKLLSSSSDSIIFMFFGVSLVRHMESEFFNWAFICFTLLFITVFRAVSVVVLTFLANKFGRLEKVKKVEQFIMIYGGLRGAVAFTLAIVLVDDDPLRKDILITTTICVVLFTTVIQGATIKKLVQWLGVKKQPKGEKTMFQTLNERAMGYVTAGVENIIGVHRHAYLMIKLEDWNKRYFRKWFERDPDLMMDEEILAMQRKIAFKIAINDAENPAKLVGRESDRAQLTQAKRNASFALELAMRAQESSAKECGMLDINILSDRAVCQKELYEMSDAFNPRSISSIIPKAKRQRSRTYSKRKYTMDSIEEMDAVEDRHFRYKRHSISHMAPPEPKKTTRHQNGRRHHRRHRNKHSKSGHSKKPDMDTLPEVTEYDEPILDSKSSFEQLTKKGSTDTFKKRNPGYSSEDHTEGESDTPDGDDGIQFIAKSDDEPLLLTNEYIPALPLSSDTAVHMSLSNNPVLDNRSKNLSEKDQAEIREAAKWRSFSESSGDNSDGVKDVVIDINDQWRDDPPPYEILDPKDNSENVENIDRTFSIETGL